MLISSFIFQHSKVERRFQPKHPQKGVFLVTSEKINRGGINSYSDW